jgi:type I restriction enzyme R subunit
VATPEQEAREKIDSALLAAGWLIQDVVDANVLAARGVALREFPLVKGHGEADYLLYVDGKAAGVVEAKKSGDTLTGVEVQAEKYSTGMPKVLPAHFRPLPFLYQSTGIETRFTNRLDPKPKSRSLFSFHRPETLAEWLDAPMLFVPAKKGVAQAERPSTLRSRLRSMPALLPEQTKGWRSIQVTTVQNLEVSFAADRPRALIQMATGAGKTFTAVSSVYRLIKHGGAKRVLFLVDRANLGRQALKEFQQYVTPDDGRKFTELYNVQLLSSSAIAPVSRVVITTIQRLFSMLKGETEFDEARDEESAFSLKLDEKEPIPVAYNPAIPIEAFDVVFTDECHRSIYNLWRQVLEYFDCFLVGLTATPSKQTFGFFNQNLVVEYGHEKAVADGVNVDFDVYRIKTEVTEKGAKLEAGLFVDRRDRETRAKRWEKLDEEISYGANQLDRDVVAVDQIRTVVRTVRDKALPEMFKDRTNVPKTLIFAKDDSHADDIVQIIREEFGQANEFCEKITYKTGTARIVEKKLAKDGTPFEAITYKSTGVKPEDLLSSFRNSYNPRIVVTVDMIATGTDVKPLEVVMFMRSVRSRLLFEQMKGRGVRVIPESDLKGVTPDANGKDRFVIIDCVGVCESPLADSRPLERDPTVPLEAILKKVGFGSTDEAVVSSLAARLARLAKKLGTPDLLSLQDVAGGVPLQSIVANLVDALDPDVHIQAAQAATGKQEPAPADIAKAAAKLIKAAVEPIAKNPNFRTRLLELKKNTEQLIDTLTADTLLEAGTSVLSKDKAKALVQSFEAFVREHKDEITAIQVLYSKRWSERLKFKDVKALAQQIESPPRSWTPEKLWRAYEELDKSKVRGANGGKLLTDVVSLVRFAIHHQDALVPFSEQVDERFRNWFAQQENRGKKFSDEQRWWLENIKNHIASSLRIESDDFDSPPFVQKGGLGKVYALFGDGMEAIVQELNEVLVA